MSTYNDELSAGDIHVRFHSFSLRERLVRANGRADSQVMVVEDHRYGLYGTPSPLLQRMILAMGPEGHLAEVLTRVPAISDPLTTRDD